MTIATLAERASVTLDAYIADIAWAPDSQSLAVAGGEGAVLVVDNVLASPQPRILGEHGMGAISVAWQPGSQIVASSGQDSAVVLWDTAAGGNAVKRLRPGTAWTEALAYSPDGKLLATATGKVLTLWNAAGEPVHQFEPLASTIAAIAWDKPGRDLAAATQGALCVHRIEPPQFTVRRYAWPAACLTAAFSPNGKVLASGMQDGTVHFWMLTTGKDSQMRGYGSKVTLTEWSANGRFLATASAAEVIVWDFGGKGPEGSAPIELKGHTDRISHLAFQPNGPWLVSAGRDWRISLWQPGKESQAVDAHLTAGEVSSVRWSPDGKTVAVGESKGRLTIYELVAQASSGKR
ncbi:MAG TPA: WD40 repeat domain-containing protein [Steroidobacteraceae bacterium]|nr:WD40 repeat domain-containing protein [Steroidobacteraceae bacterium]